ITERLGQDYSDRILKNTAECITRNLKDGQNVYRVAADEYLIYDTAGGTTSDAHELFHKIRADVDYQVESNHYKALYTVSGGIISNSDFDTISFENIIKLTDFTLNSARRRGHNQLYYYARNDYDAFLRRRALRLALRESVDEDFRGFELYYQPIVSVGSEKLYAAEALLRYTLKNGEHVSPNEFIPVLEETGLIIPVGKWVIRKAMNTCKEFQKKLPNFRISVNLSYIQLMRSPIFNEILDALNETALSPDSLIVELTESGQLDNTIAIKNIWDKLKSHGVSLAIDDFGTGYSNLGNIGNLRPDIVKLDRNFTLKALNNDYEHQLMTNIICMVHSIGLNLVVEGVETNDEQTKISSLSPDYIQGYYYSRPCPVEEFKRKFNL
ncbi:MAG: EAL domain-containing protein, partial [Lachnospiraceae bacterium]